MAGPRLATGFLGAATLLLSLAAAATDGATADLLDRAVALETQVRTAAAVTDDIRIYVSNTLPDWELIEVELRLDDLPARRHAYSLVEGRALNGGGLHRIAALGAGTTPRGGLVEYFIRERNSSRAVKPLRGRLDITLAPGVGQYLVQLQARRLGAPELVWGPAAGRVDAELRYADFLDDSAHPARAAFVRAAHGDTRRRFAAQADQPQIAQFNAALGAATPAALLPLAETEPDDPLGWALRDRANLRLGYLQLRAGAPDIAAEAFQRVRSPGPNSNAALLGYGWARLIPPEAPNASAMYAASTSLRPGDADALAEARRTTPFRYTRWPMRTIISARMRRPTSISAARSASSTR
jgi:hypothetical protein